MTPMTFWAIWTGVFSTIFLFLGETYIFKGKSKPEKILEAPDNVFDNPDIGLEERIAHIQNHLLSHLDQRHRGTAQLVKILETKLGTNLYEVYYCLCDLESRGIIRKDTPLNYPQEQRWWLTDAGNEYRKLTRIVIPRADAPLS